MAKVTWEKDGLKEEATYRSLNVQISKKADDPTVSSYNKGVWYGTVCDSDGNIILPPKNQRQKYKLSRSVVEAREQIIRVIEDNWHYYSGDMKREEVLLGKRQYVMQNIHHYADLFPTTTEINTDTLWAVVNFAFDNFDDCETLFALQKQLSELLLDHYKAQDKWMSLPEHNRAREVFSHLEEDTVSRKVHNVSSYWEYDEESWQDTQVTRSINAPNPSYVSEPRFPYSQSAKLQSDIKKLRDKLSAIANNVDLEVNPSSALNLKM